MKHTECPAITFGIIVLNGEPFTAYNLRALYPFAHQIIVVEGACPSAKDFATEDGHSQDGTLHVLKRFQQEEDPGQKVLVVTAEQEGHRDGFWTEKDEMSHAYARRATGNYLWQVDMDEFYFPADMKRVITMLSQKLEITAVTFHVRTFWGGLSYRTDGIYLRREAQNFHRLFAWGSGYRYLTHRPPTVIDGKGRNLMHLRAVTGSQMARLGIYMYHYSFLFPFQADFKLAYYGNMDRQQGVPRQSRREAWHRNYHHLTKPFFIDDTSILGEPSWLVRYLGGHPEEIDRLWADIEQGRFPVQRRAINDIERLLNRPGYRLTAKALPLLWLPRDGFERVLSLLRRLKGRIGRRKSRR